MKRRVTMVLLLALSLVAFSQFGCQPAGPETNRSAVEPNTNSSRETSSASALSEADAIAKEKAIWDTIKNKDYEAFGSMLANDQIEVGPDGAYDKAKTIAAVREFEPTEITFTDWKFVPIDKHAIVVTYTAHTKGKHKGKEFPPETVRASSAWVNRDGKWLGMYHQECQVKTAPAPAAASSAAKTATTPASTSTPVMGSDPIANEKAIWEALKSRNYDGFASALAPEAIEVEPNGVYDKAGTVKVVSQFDASKVELSDFKTVAFDSDAALVTYMVKMPRPEPAERHSTIWTRRDGKWLAVFHHGTPVSRTAAASASPAMK